MLSSNERHVSFFWLACLRLPMKTLPLPSGGSGLPKFSFTGRDATTERSQKMKLLPYVRILCECGNSPLEPARKHTLVKLAAVWLYTVKLWYTRDGKFKCSKVMQKLYWIDGSDISFHGLLMPVTALWYYNPLQRYTYPPELKALKPFGLSVSLSPLFRVLATKKKTLSRSSSAEEIINDKLESREGCGRYIRILKDGRIRASRLLYGLFYKRWKRDRAFNIYCKAVIVALYKGEAYGRAKSICERRRSPFLRYPFKINLIIDNVRKRNLKATRSRCKIVPTQSDAWTFARRVRDRTRSNSRTVSSAIRRGDYQINKGRGRRRRVQPSCLVRYEAFTRKLS
ncbi:hypothetical protein EVAR_69027_1 [Eumeta japonica]|uniref:Uncharacterized protein n=1 Tax=Eumeta variegata TaxID=151549 RepID=A0A4C2A290_EUMVA|nr:hypothetical protein EVAR_69027_1 [Eumeta japonica]